jgi:hypothetical protein
MEAITLPTYRVEAILSEDGKLTLSNLPFHAGEAVEVIVLSRSVAAPRGNRHPLRGTPVAYIEPTGTVAEPDWDVIRKP